ncbi:hypothetical protein [Algibacter sp. Ld11]|uniref:hypothetical protein n=1 Tax=Algibacter sp. Ld11 TaxID=649150 RepID=UPI0038631B17
MKKIVFLVFALILFQNNYAQKHFSVEILTGVGFNKNLTLVNESVEDYNVFTTQVNANYQFNLYKKLFAETGIGAQWYFSSGDIAVSNFNATSLQLNLPFIICYPILNKTTVGAGLQVSNNRDFENFDFRANYNIRTSILVKGSFNIKNNLDLLLIAKQNLSNTPDLYLLNRPNFDIAIGLACKLF